MLQKQNNKETKILYPFNASEYQTFMQDLADEIIRRGYRCINPVSLSLKLRIIIANLKLSRNFKILSDRESMIVLCGGYPDYAAFPFAYNHNIIPFIWDTWPKYWDRMISSFRRHNIRLAFFTQRSVAEYIGSVLPDTNCVYIPEGLNPEGYSPGKPLIDRNIDILELGRLYNPIHTKLKQFSNKKNINHRFANDVTQKRLFDTFEDLTAGLSNSKIVINYPRSITHPELAGNIETLTQRYWECMFSRCLMVGKAPQELIDLIGYNPVIECNVADIEVKIAAILKNIDDYQNLVDRNYKAAVDKGTWRSRVNLMEKYLS